MRGPMRGPIFRESRGLKKNGFQFYIVSRIEWPICRWFCKQTKGGQKRDSV